MLTFFISLAEYEQNYDDFWETLLLSMSCRVSDDVEKSKNILSDIFQKILNNCNDAGIAPEMAIVSQSYFVDPEYRDSFHSYYSNKHMKYQRYCTRLFLFKKCEGRPESPLDWINSNLNDAFIGCIVIKPTLRGMVGRTLIKPEYLLPYSEAGSIYTRLSTYYVSFHGKPLEIKTFPYRMQDSEATTCAEVTIINLMDYFGNHYRDYCQIYSSNIQSAVSIDHYERSVPSRGLSYKTVTRALKGFGLSPRLYPVRRSGYGSIQPEKTLHYYIESGIPVAICLRPYYSPQSMLHSIICVGHGKGDMGKILRHAEQFKLTESPQDSFYFADTANGYDSYIVMDDNHSPYQKYSFSRGPKQTVYFGNGTDDKRTIEYLSVPLHKRTYLEAENAFSICKKILGDAKIIEIIKNRYAANFPGAIPIGDEKNPLLLRLFLASARSYINHRVNSISTLDAFYSDLPLPKAVWVCELYDQSHYGEKKILGEIVLDATATEHTGHDSLLLENYLDRVYACYPDKEPLKCMQSNPPDVDSGKRLFAIISDWVPMSSYENNLKSIVLTG